MEQSRFFALRAGGTLFLVLALTPGCDALKRSSSSAPLPGTPRYFREQASRAGRVAAVPAVIPEARQIVMHVQHENGPGIVVCEPTANPEPRSVSDFGDGCARWLHFQVAGHGEFGKTPVWDNLHHAFARVYSQGKTLTLPEAAGLARSTGATHAAVGQIHGTEQRCTLEYQLYEIPARKPVGAPLKAEGTFEQVRAQLPDIARKLTQSLGVEKPRVAERVVETPADLQFLGRLPRAKFPHITPEQVRRLEQVAQTSALGALFYTLDAENVSLTEVTKRGQHLLTLAPNHPVAWGVVGVCSHAVRRPGEVISIQGLEDAVEKYPTNYQLRASLGLISSRATLWARTRYLTEEAVKCAVDNPFAWWYLEEALSLEANGIRHGRVASAITAEEWKKLNYLYPIGLDVAKQLVKLDPTVGGYWLTLSGAATPGNNPVLADQAYWKAVQLGLRTSQLYFWGLEMYQPKWFGNPAKLQKVAKMALASNFTTSDERLHVAHALYRAECRDERGPLYLRVLRTAEERKQMAAFVKGEQPVIYSLNETRHRIQRKKRKSARLSEPLPPPASPYLKAVGSHAGGVTALAIAPDGRFTAAGGGDGQISLASAEGNPVAELTGHSHSVLGLAWSADGKRLASAAADGTVRVWDPAAGQMLLILEGHRGRVLSVAWHPQTGRLLSGGDDGTLREWDPISGKSLRTVKGIPGEVRSLAYHPNGTLLAVSLGDPENRVVLREGATLAAGKTLSKPPHLLHALAWNADGSRLATASTEGIHLWNPESGELVRTLPTPDHFAMSLGWNADGRELLYLGGDRQLYQVDAGSGKERLVGEVSQYAVFVVWDAQAGWLVTGGADGNVLHCKTRDVLRAPRPQKVAARPN